MTRLLECRWNNTDEAQYERPKLKQLTLQQRKQSIIYILIHLCYIANSNTRALFYVHKQHTRIKYTYKMQFCAHK